MAISYIYIAYRNYRLPCLKPLMFFLVFFDLKLLMTLFQWYCRINLDGYSPAGAGSPVSPLFDLHIVLFFALTTYALLFFIQKLDGIRIPSPFRGILITIFSLVTLYYAAGLSFLVLKIPHDRLIGLNLNSAFVYTFYILTFIFLFRLLFLSRGEPDPFRSRTKRSFAWCYLALYSLLFISGYFPLSPEIFIILVDKILFNLFPVYWIKAYLLKSENPAPPVIQEANAEAVGQKFGLTQRESEIAGLLLQGKSNREIADSLNIAHHTVKNHIYRLYQKLKINKRYQLVNLFLRHMNSNGADPPKPD